jgi:hypothetical protein
MRLLECEAVRRKESGCESTQDKPAPLTHPNKTKDVPKEQRNRKVDGLPFYESSAHLLFRNFTPMTYHVASWARFKVIKKVKA